MILFLAGLGFFPDFSACRLDRSVDNGVLANHAIAESLHILGAVASKDVGHLDHGG